MQLKINSLTLSNLLKKNYFALFVLFSSFVFFLPDTYDSNIIDYGFEIKDFSGIQTFLTTITRYFDLVLLQIIFQISIFFNISYQLIFDFLTIIILILFSYEVKKYSEIVFKLDNYWSNVCSILVITFPTWHILVSSMAAINVTYIYFVLLGYRMLISKNIKSKSFGILLIICSFNIMSNLAFIVGLSLAHNIMQHSRKEKIQIRLSSLIIGLSLFYYLFKSVFFLPYGNYENYNQVNFEYLKPSFVLHNLYNFLTFFLYYLWIPLIYILFIKFFKINTFVGKIFKIDLFLSFLSISLIFICAIAPYLLVNKSVDLFYFSDYESRHAMLVSVSFSLFFTILLKTIKEMYSNKKISNFFLILIVFQSLCILNLSIYQKIEDSFFKRDFVEQLKKISNLRSGRIEILSNQLSFTYMRPYEVNYLFFKAFGKRVWNINFTETKTGIVIGDGSHKPYYELDSIVGDCDTTIKFFNEIDRLQRFKSLYIFNFKDYFRIKLLNTTC